jgi:hypothetical protein
MGQRTPNRGNFPSLEDHYQAAVLTYRGRRGEQCRQTLGLRNSALA